MLDSGIYGLRRNVYLFEIIDIYVCTIQTIITGCN